MIIRGDQVNPGSTGWELGIRNLTMGTIQGVCARGRELSARVLVTVGVTVVTATYLSRAHGLTINTSDNEHITSLLPK